MLGIFGTLPSALTDAAITAVSGATKIFDDIGSGDIVKDLENLPDAVLSGITNALGNLPAEVEHGVTKLIGGVECILKDCSHPSTADAYTCHGLDATTTSAGATSTYPPEISLVITSTVPRGNLTGTPASAQSSLITSFPAQTRPPTISTRRPGPSASAIPSTSEGGSGGMQMIASPRVFQLCWVVAFGIFSVALLL